MNENQNEMLMNVMSIDFTLLELNLYLNTHPTDKKALALYNENLRISSMLRDKYEKAYGPLTPRYGYDFNNWRWIESPWPWEIN